MEDLELIHQQMTSKGGRAAIGEEKQIAILFADLRGFTNFSEALPAYDVIYVLNRYFDHMGKIVERHGGVISNYMGDGCMALFGVDDRDRAAERAVRAAVDMQNAMVSINTYLEDLYYRQLQIGIGVHFGQVVLGAVSAANSKQITAIGDAVNLASRIEAANKTVGTNLLISEDTYALVRNLVSINRRCQVKIPGKSGEYLLYEVTNITPSDEIESAIAAPPVSRTLISRFVEFLKALQSYLFRLFH